MNIQSDILFFVIFVLTTLINSSGAFGWYDGYRYNMFTKPQISEDSETDSQAILSLWSKYHFLRRRRTSLDNNIFRPNGLFMKRFLHYSPLIFMKNKHAKSNKTKLKTIPRKQEKHVYKPFNAFGMFINAFRQPLQTESIHGDAGFTENVPEINTEDHFHLQREGIPTLKNAVLDVSNEESRVVPNLSEIESVEPIRPNLPISNQGISRIADQEDSDSDISNDNHFGIMTSQDQVGDDLVGASHRQSSGVHLIPFTDDTGNRFSDLNPHGVSSPSKETAKNLDLPQIVLEPIHQRASVSGGFGEELHSKLGSFFPDDSLDQDTFDEFSSEPVKGFDTGFNDVFQDGQTDYGTFRDIIPDNSDFSNDDQVSSDIPVGFGFSDQSGFLDESGISDKDLLSKTGSFEGSFAPYQNIDNFYNEEFGTGFDNFENLDSSDIAGGEFFNDGNGFEGFFDTDESGCEGIRTRSCHADTECSCLGLYFCIEGTCAMRAAIPNGDLGDSTETAGTWSDMSGEFL
ncbi:uncharacterized protein LOC117331290 [Pecten maximus]|uniref:uncharacterized protein LOC117331290 n=1 Tax=Pecten maximus TaxID=6579 RepID=UPI0014581977|nr:uncharacterized protein LOC117331290 [Pecten maximus]XP_033745794.1 uncharacterized protein LOC117331290 [Pecten maximus]XP_033745796.1 uncharacterized protein LOC117331290 [Pecten maximus]